MGEVTMRTSRVALAILTASATRTTGQAPRVRDSAGVHIVENGPRLRAPIAFTIGAKPIFDVGGVEADPANEFSPRQGYFRGLRLSNGSVVVIDASRLQFFDAAGKRLRIV